MSVVHGYIFKKERTRIRIFSLFSSVSEILKQDLGENPSEITTTLLKSHLIVENAGRFKCLYKSTSKWSGANLGAVHKWWPHFLRGQSQELLKNRWKVIKKRWHVLESSAFLRRPQKFGAIVLKVLTLLSAKFLWPSQKSWIWKKNNGLSYEQYPRVLHFSFRLVKQCSSGHFQRCFSYLSVLIFPKKLKVGLFNFF